MSKLSIVVNIYKNEANIMPFYEEFMKEIAPKLDDYELIMVNDKSPDDSWTVMRKIAANNPNIKLINLSRNFGAVAASFVGLSYATGDCVCTKAVDLQEPSSLLLEMYNKWKEGNKAVIAVRKERNDSILTNSFSNLYYKLVQQMISKDMPDGGFDIYLIDRILLNKVLSMNDKNSPITLQILWMGFEPYAVYYIRKKREIGKSSWTFSKKMKLFVDSFVGFSYVPIRFMSVVGVCSFVVTFAWGVYLAIARMYGKIEIQGYTTIIITMLFSLGLIMFTLGVLGEYIWRILDNVRNRPIAIVENTVNVPESEQPNNL